METGANNNEPFLQRLDPAFSPARCREAYHLALYLQAQQLTAAVLEKDSLRYVAFEQYRWENYTPQPIASCLSASKFLRQHFASCNVSFASRQFTLVPLAVLETEKTADYLWLNHEPADHLEVLTDRIFSLEAANIYAVDQTIKTQIEQQFANAQFLHHLTPLIESLLRATKQQQQSMLVAHVQENQFELLVLEGGILKFANTFQYQSLEDFLYYTLYTFEQLGIKPSESELKVLGHKPIIQPILEASKKYIAKVQPAEAVHGVSFAPALADLSQPAHTILFNQFLCA